MIKLDNIYYKYHNEKANALDGVSLIINENEKIAIIGDNGSGKSTLAKVLVGLVKPASGSCVVDGIELSHQNLNEIRSKVNIVFQNPNLQFIGSTVEEDIAWGLENKNTPRPQMQKEVSEIGNRLNLSDKFKLMPSKLSGGQKQRAAMASVLVLKPQYLILDEVTSMLDSKGRSEVWDLLQNLNASHDHATITITHNMDEAALASRIIVMHKGKIIGDGTPQEIFNKNYDETVLDQSFEYLVSSKVGSIKKTLSFDELVGELCK